MWFYIAHSFT